VNGYDKENPAPGQSRPDPTAVDKERNLFEFRRQRKPAEEGRYVLLARFEFLSVSLLPPLPAVGIQGGLHLNKLLLAGMKRHHVEFAVIPASRPLPDLDVPPDEEAPELIPLGHQFFEMVSWRGTLPFNFVKSRRLASTQLSNPGGMPARSRRALGE